VCSAFMLCVRGYVFYSNSFLFVYLHIQICVRLQIQGPVPFDSDERCEGTGTWPDYLVNCVLTKKEGPHRKKIVRKSTNSFQVNSGGVGAHGQFESEPK